MEAFYFLFFFGGVHSLRGGNQILKLKCLLTLGVTVNLNPTFQHRKMKNEGTDVIEMMVGSSFVCDW